MRGITIPSTKGQSISGDNLTVSDLDIAKSIQVLHDQSSLNGDRTVVVQSGDIGTLVPVEPTLHAPVPVPNPEGVPLDGLNLTSDGDLDPVVRVLGVQAVVVPCPHQLSGGDPCKEVSVMEGGLDVVTDGKELPYHVLMGRGDTSGFRGGTNGEVGLIDKGDSCSKSEEYKSGDDLLHD